MILPLIGPEKDIPAPDVGTNAEIMGWIMDTFSMFKGYTVPGVVTGKPIEIGGSLGRQEATGRGVMLVTKEILDKLHVSSSTAEVAVQGFGNVGRTAAKLLYKEGYKIVGVSDVTGGIYQKAGLDIDRILKFLELNKDKMLEDYKEEGVEHISNEALLTCDCYVLVPAALENQITEEVAKKIKAKIIIEGANGPTTVDADRILETKGVRIVPDILANAGGVVVSYFEWVQNIQSLTWEEEEVNCTLKKIMIKAFSNVWDTASSYGTTLRMGAYMVALDRIVKAKKIRSIFP